MKILTPLTQDQLKNLKAGDLVYITGTIYTARDAAHKKMVDMINNNQPLPIPIKDSIIYYVGPTPAKPSEPIGSCGPTTSYRMDPFLEPLLKLGLSGSIGKGARSENIKELLTKYNSVYFQAIGGTAAYLSKFVKSSKLIAFPELQSEAIRELTVEDFPVFVTYDIYGNDLIKDEISKYKK
ncbi:FumA C-terminus/TtdB family hydratase beta subunit [Mycoplasmatota bacterium zrk1]